MPEMMGESKGVVTDVEETERSGGESLEDAKHGNNLAWYSRELQTIYLIENRSGNMSELCIFLKI